jgi:hypothetical protein
MQEAFDPDPDNISRILRANGAASWGHKIKTESKSVLEETAISAEMEYRFMMPEVPIRTEPAAFNSAAVQGTNSSGPGKKQEERIYKGATYVKGEDGQWHLKQ